VATCWRRIATAVKENKFIGPRFMIARGEPRDASARYRRPRPRAQKEFGCGAVQHHAVLQARGLPEHINITVQTASSRSGGAWSIATTNPVAIVGRKLLRHQTPDQEPAEEEAGEATKSEK